MRLGRTLYRREADIGRTTSRNQNRNTFNGWGAISHRVEFRQDTTYAPYREASQILGFDETETYLIPACS